MLAQDDTLGIPADQVGYYSGVVESTLAFAQRYASEYHARTELTPLSLTSYHWGVASDRYGRKPIFLLACLGTALFTFLTGFAKHFRWLVAVRFLSGCLCGMAGPSKVALAELATKENGTCRAGQSMI
jgi:MFS family permease